MALTTQDLSNPILNSPYEPPAAHFDLGDHGPTGEVLPGRRPSESFIPVPVSRKGRAAAGEALVMDFDVTGERREQNTLINDTRYQDKLLEHAEKEDEEGDEVLKVFDV